MGTFLYFAAISVFVLLCLVLCFVILIQEGKSAGLAPSFGGSASDSVFGTSTADVLKKFTAWLAIAFFVSCIILSLWTSAIGRTKQADTSAFPVETLE